MTNKRAHVMSLAVRYARAAVDAGGHQALVDNAAADKAAADEKLTDANYIEILLPRSA